MCSPPDKVELWVKQVTETQTTTPGKPPTDLRQNTEVFLQVALVWFCQLDGLISLVELVKCTAGMCLLVCYAVFDLTYMSSDLCLQSRLVLDISRYIYIYIYISKIMFCR